MPIVFFRDYISLHQQGEALKSQRRIRTVDGSEIRRSNRTTVWMVLKPIVNNGINYQPQLVQISEPSTVTLATSFRLFQVNGFFLTPKASPLAICHGSELRFLHICINQPLKLPITCSPNQNVTIYVEYGKPNRFDNIP